MTAKKADTKMTEHPDYCLGNRDIYDVWKCLCHKPDKDSDDYKAGLQAGRAESADADRYRMALESISKNTCCDRCQEAALVAKVALAQRDGGTKK